MSDVQCVKSRFRNGRARSFWDLARGGSDLRIMFSHSQVLGDNMK
jgi:hypothetical protein